jgi:hypothetical protein
LLIIGCCCCCSFANVFPEADNDNLEGPCLGEINGNCCYKKRICKKTNNNQTRKTFFTGDFGGTFVVTSLGDTIPSSTTKEKFSMKRFKTQ